jgi:hypothetical protein
MPVYLFGDVGERYVESSLSLVKLRGFSLFWYQLMWVCHDDGYLAISLTKHPLAETSIEFASITTFLPVIVRVSTVIILVIYGPMSSTDMAALRFHILSMIKW